MIDRFRGGPNKSSDDVDRQLDSDRDPVSTSTLDASQRDLRAELARSSSTASLLSLSASFHLGIINVATVWISRCEFGIHGSVNRCNGI